MLAVHSISDCLPTFSNICYCTFNSHDLLHHGSRTQVIYHTPPNYVIQNICRSSKNLVPVRSWNNFRLEYSARSCIQRYAAWHGSILNGPGSLFQALTWYTSLCVTSPTNTQVHLNIFPRSHGRRNQELAAHSISCTNLIKTFQN